MCLHIFNGCQFHLLLPYPRDCIVSLSTLQRYEYNDKQIDLGTSCTLCNAQPRKRGTRTPCCHCLLRQSCLQLSPRGAALAALEDLTCLLEQTSQRQPSSALLMCSYRRCCFVPAVPVFASLLLLGYLQMLVILLFAVALLLL
jgi:hypothetical protein